MAAKVIRIVFWDKEHKVLDIVENPVTTVPGKLPAWFRTVVSLLRMASKWNNVEQFAHANIEFLED